MEYDFISHMDRVGKDALALDVDALRLYMPKAKIKKGVSLIPMSVADMNFATAPSITDALKKRVEHPAFGYFIPRKEYYDAILKWQNEQNGADVSQDDIGYTNGVLGGLISALNVFCSRGDDVLLNTPAYVGFTGCLSDNGYHAVHSPMKQDADGIWRMDFDDMEQKIIKNHIHAAIFCSPHNPTGRVWERWEIEEFMALCKKHDVYVVADEIWSDLILYGNKHIPTQSVSEDAKNRVVALYSLAKTFNLAGIVGAYSVIYNPTIRDRINKESSLSRYNEMSVLYMHSVMGAYTDDGKEWLNQLRKVLAQNVDYAKEYIDSNYHGVKCVKPQGTYMLFIDCEEWCKAHNMTTDDLVYAGIYEGVIWQSGEPFFAPYHIRMNLALPLAEEKEALIRLKENVFI